MKSSANRRLLLTQRIRRSEKIRSKLDSTRPTLLTGVGRFGKMLPQEINSCANALTVETRFLPHDLSSFPIQSTVSTAPTSTRSSLSRVSSTPTRQTVNCSLRVVPKTRVDSTANTQGVANAKACNRPIRHGGRA